MKKLTYNLRIEGHDNGVLVKAGCVQLVYHQSNFATLLNDLEAYLKDPDATVKSIMRRENIDLEQTVMPQQPPTYPRVDGSRIVPPSGSGEAKQPR